MRTTSSPINIPTILNANSFFPSSIGSDSSNSPVGSPLESKFISSVEISSDIETAKKVLREIGNLSNFIFENANRDDANLADDNRKAIKITGEILSDSFVAKILKDEQFSAEEESEVNAKVEMISKKIAEIKIVQMVGIGIDEIPTSIKHLTGIRSLGLNSNNLKSLPEELKFLVSMTTLNLCGNSKLKMLPRSLAEIKSLKRILIDNTGIRELQSVFHGKVDPTAQIQEWIA